MNKYKIAVLDDYQNVALESADWSVLRDRADIAVFQDHLADPDAMIERLLPFDVVCVMRERSPGPGNASNRKSTGRTNIMATFIVFTRESTQDQNELNIYLSKVGETLEGHPVKLHAGPQQVLEGPVPEVVVILEFPTTTAARKWYGGPAYQAIVQHRFKGATYRAVLVEGV